MSQNITFLVGGTCCHPVYQPKVDVVSTLEGTPPPSLAPRRSEEGTEGAVKNCNSPFLVPEILGCVVPCCSRLTHKGDRTFAVRALML